MKLERLGQLLIALNVLDGMATLWTVKVFGAAELNPIWNLILEWPICFLLIKLVTVWVWADWLVRFNVRWVVVLLCVVYTLVLGAHLMILSTVLSMNSA